MFKWGKIRFYCPACKRFMDRFEVYGNDWDPTYKCKSCDNTVIQTKKILLAIIKDYIAYIIKNGEIHDYE